MRTALLLLLLSGTAIAGVRTAPVVRIVRDAQTWNVVASVGSNDAITKTMTCAFVDAKDHVITDDCRLVRIDKAETTCKTSTALPEVVRVRFAS
ncbi:MAG: hypothetical protein ABI678_02040 [Kofleriaceae bacterium]